MISRTLIIWSLFCSYNGTHMPCSDGFIRSAGSNMNCYGVRHWNRLIKIPGDTDCYYCINNMTCLIHTYYCWVVLVTVPDNLSTIKLPVYIVTLPGTCYTFCSGILLMYTYTLHFMYFLFHIYSSCTHYSCTLMTL